MPTEIGLKQIGKVFFYIGFGLFWLIFSIIVCLTHPIFVLTTLCSMVISGTRLAITTIKYKREERRKNREDAARALEENRVGADVASIIPSEAPHTSAAGPLEDAMRNRPATAVEH